MNRAIVNRIIPFSSVDGPGNRTAIFLQGCPFECKYCHNPETIKKCVNCGECVIYCKTGALAMTDGKVFYDREKCVMCDECIHNCPNLSSPRTVEMSVDEVISKVSLNIPFVRGITVSGGECTVWRDFLVELFFKARALNLGTLIDSNGSYDFSKDEELLSVTDGVMLDIKAWNETEHYSVTGCSNSMVLSNLDFLLSRNKLTEVRTVVVPELFDASETIKNVADRLAGANRSDVRMKIIKFRENGVRNEYKKLVPPNDDFLVELKETAERYGLTDVVII